MTIISLSRSGARGSVTCLHGGVGGGQRAAAQVCAQPQVYPQLLMRPAEAPELGHTGLTSSKVQSRLCAAPCLLEIRHCLLCLYVPEPCAAPHAEEALGIRWADSGKVVERAAPGLRLLTRTAVALAQSDVTILELWSLLKAHNFQGRARMVNCG